MNDHKLDRFKRAFGANPSDDLITNRSNKVTAALAVVDTEINRLAATGLDAGGLQRLRDDIEQDRLNAVGRNTKKEQYTSLSQVKADARKLAADAPGIVDESVNELAGNLDRARKDVKAQVDDAKRLTLPQATLAVAAVLKTVEDDARLAEAKANDKLRLDALDVIDLQPLKDALVKAKSADVPMKCVNRLFVSANRELANLPPGQEKDGFNQELKTATDERDDLANEADIDELIRRAQQLDVQMKDLWTRIDNASRAHMLRDCELINWRKACKTVVDQAKAIVFTTGVAVVKGPLDVVETAVQDAESKGTDQEKIDAYKLIDLKPLNLAVGSARDIDGGVPALLDGLEKVIAKLPGNKKTSDLQKELTRLKSLALPLATETDLETARKGYAAIKTPGDKLMNEALKVGGKDLYTEALKSRFGVDVSSKEGARINLVGAYDMLALVPESHVGHDKLVKLNFTASKEGGGAYLAGKIDMDNFGSGNDGYIYTVEGKTVKPNGFNVCMLHEIGHAVDDKYSIMDGLMGKAGYGDWRKEDKSSVLAVLRDEAVQKLGTNDDAVKQLVEGVINSALGGGDVRKPDAMDANQWKTVRNYAETALAITEKKKPWFNAKPGSVQIGGRVYVESYANNWHSYGLAEYAGQNVRDYQWRAPGEWFADLYGVLWMTKKPAPSGVGSALARWLPT